MRVEGIRNRDGVGEVGFRLEHDKATEVCVIDGTVTIEAKGFGALAGATNVRWFSVVDEWQITRDPPAE